MWWQIPQSPPELLHISPCVLLYLLAFGSRSSLPRVPEYQNYSHPLAPRKGLWFFCDSRWDGALGAACGSQRVGKCGGVAEGWSDVAIYLYFNTYAYKIMNIVLDILLIFLLNCKNPPLFIFLWDWHQTAAVSQDCKMQFCFCKTLPILISRIYSRTPSSTKSSKPSLWVDQASLLLSQNCCGTITYKAPRACATPVAC